MGFESIITIVIIVIAFILFATEYLRVDHVAIGLMVAFVVFGVLDPAESLAGFSNSATLTVAAMFVLGDALIKAGIIEKTNAFFSKLISGGYSRSILSMNVFVGGISAFINNTPVVATFIPIISNATRKSNKKPSKYLIPLSYGAIFGGTCTLIGTSTNLLVDGIARDSGLEGFSMFLFAPLGLTFFIVGSLYIILVGRKLLPEKRLETDFEDDEGLKDYMTEIEILDRINEYSNGQEMSKVDIRIDNILGQSDSSGAEVVKVKRDGESFDHPDVNFVLQKDDSLLVRGDLKEIKEILRNNFLAMSQRFGGERDFPEEETRVMEIVVLPNSDLVGEKIRSIDFFKGFQSRVLAIRHRGKKMFEKMGGIVIHAGDVLLLQCTDEGFENLKRAEKSKKAPFLSLSTGEVGSSDNKDILITGAVIAAVVLLASFNVLHISIGAYAGIFTLVLLGKIKMERAYRAIDWKVVFLLAGALAMGAALNKTGLSSQIAGVIEEQVATQYGPAVVVSAIYILCNVLTETMSNNAAAALMAPIAIQLAVSLNLSPTPFLLAITFAGSASFSTPIGYQTNTMVYSVGNYKFSDFTKVGLPLNLLFWLIASLLIPVFYPF